MNDLPFCFAPGCRMAGTAWPTILIGRAEGGAPYRLEVPRAVCEPHQVEFRPAVYLAPLARDYLRFLARAWSTSEPDFASLDVEWRPLDHPSFVELGGGREDRFCAPVVT